nr:MAG: CI repressor [Bacteriophage sp.]
MAEFHKQLLKAMDLKGITQKELCKKTNIPKSAMSQYMSGKFKPKQKRTYLLAKALDVNEAWLMGFDNVSMERENEEEEQAIPLPQANVFMRPVYDSISAGFGVIAQDVPVDYMPTYITCPSEQDKYIWINVHGDSMSPLIDDGSKILIKKQTSVDSGQIAAVLVDNEEAVVKKVLYNNNTVELHSVNPYYPPRVFKNNDVTRVQILGLVKEVSKALQ